MIFRVGVGESTFGLILPRIWNSALVNCSVSLKLPDMNSQTRQRMTFGTQFFHLGAWAALALCVWVAPSSSFAAKLPTTAVIETTSGKIKVKLFADRTPKTVENFAGLATGKKTWTSPVDGKEVKGKSLYAGTVFHRVIPDFMIQGGDPAGNGTGGPGYRFEDETEPTDSFAKAGVLAMANSGPNTNGSQFFITVAPTPWLNGRHTIFGEVTSGMDVVNTIATSPRDARDRPLQEIKIIKVTVQ